MSLLEEETCNPETSGSILFSQCSVSFNVALDPSFLHGVEAEEVAAGPALSDTSRAQGDDSSGSNSNDDDEHENDCVAMLKNLVAMKDHKLGKCLLAEL